MQRQFSIYILVFNVILCSCSRTKPDAYQKFTVKKEQDVSERIIKTLMLVDSLNITKVFKGLSISEMSLSESSIIAKLNHKKIVRLNQQHLSTITIFSIPKGKGPGEILDLNTARVQAGKDFLAIYAGKEKKTALYDLNGNFKEEFLNGGYQVGDMAMADSKTYYFELMPGNKYLFSEVERTSKSGSTVRRHFQLRSDDIPILAYFGSLAVHNQSFYFAGYSVPIIRRYDLSGKDVELVFSRSIIDGFDQEQNFNKPKEASGGSIFWAFSRTAQFATRDLGVDDNYIYSVRDSRRRPGYKYLDLYSVKNGDYFQSFRLKYYPTEIVMNKNYIYLLEKTEKHRIWYLMKYEKPDAGF